LTGRLFVKSKRWSEEQLVRACVDGDEHAWHALVDRYKNLVRSISVKAGLSQDEASDAFQGVFVEVLRGLPKLREPKALTKWIIQISVAECRRARRDARLTAMDDGDFESIQDTSASPPAEMLVQVERENAVREAVASLPSRCQNLIRMLFFEGKPRSYAETAASLGLAPGSIGFIRERCLDKLRKALAAMGLS
jgi:RNA polymerase sigma factor (sigma-70 family)